MKAAIKVIPIILIIAAFSAILSVNTLASTLTADNVTAIVMYGYDSSLTTQAWRSVSFSRSDGNIVTDFINYGQSQQRIHFNMNPVKYGNIAIETTFTANNITAAGTPYIYIVFNDNTHTEVNCAITQINSSTYYISAESAGNNKVIKEIRLYSRFSIVSTNATYKSLKITINDVNYTIVDNLADIKNDVDTIQQDISDIKNAIVGTETIPIDNSGEDHLLDKLDEETGVINDLIDEFRAFDISMYTGGIYAVMYMSTPWTNQEWFKAVMVVLLTLFALITVVRGLRR